MLKKPIIFALRISFIQWGINETITTLSWKFEDNRTSGRFYFFKQKKEHKKWNPTVYAITTCLAPYGAITITCLYFFYKFSQFRGSDWSHRAATQHTSSRFLVPRKSMKAHAILSMLVVLVCTLLSATFLRACTLERLFVAHNPNERRPKLPRPTWCGAQQSAARCDFDPSQLCKFEGVTWT